MIEAQLKSNFAKADRDFITEFAKLNFNVTETNATLADVMLKDIWKKGFAQEKLTGTKAEGKEGYGKTTYTYQDVSGSYRDIIEYIRDRRPYFKQRNDRGRKKKYGKRPTREKARPRRIWVKSRIVQRNGGVDFKKTWDSAHGSWSKAIRSNSLGGKELGKKKANIMRKFKGDLKVQTKTTGDFSQEIEFSVSGRNAKSLGFFHSKGQNSGIINPATEKPYKQGKRPVIANGIRRNLKRYDRLQQNEVLEPWVKLMNAKKYKEQVY